MTWTTPSLTRLEDVAAAQDDDCTDDDHLERGWHEDWCS